MIIPKTPGRYRWVTWAKVLFERARLALAPSGPLRAVHLVLALLTFVGAASVLSDLYKIVADPTEWVFVAQEGTELRVWRDVFSYEASTGKKWIEQPRSTTQLLAVHESAGREGAVASIGRHVGLLVLSAWALRAVCRYSSAQRAAVRGVAAAPASGSHPPA